MAVLSWDLIMIAITLIASFAWFYTKGKDFIVTMILATYAAAAVIVLAPLVKNFTQIDFGIAPYQLSFIVFVVLILLFSWMMGTNGYFEPYIVPSSWEVPIFAVLFAGLFLAVGATFVPAEIVDNFSPLTRFLFTHEASATAWLIAPIGVLLFIRGET